MVIVINSMISNEEFLYQFSKLSVRAKTVCFNSNLNELGDFIRYMTHNNSFLNLRNCGTLTNLELLEFCKAIQIGEYYEPRLPELNETLLKYSNLNDQSLIDFTNWYCIRAKKLSIRSKNAISKIQNQKTIGQVLSLLLDDQFNALSIKNIGKKSGREINEFIIEIRNYLDNESVENLDDTHSFRLKMLRLFDIDIWDNTSQCPVTKNVLFYFEQIVSHCDYFNISEQEAIKFYYYLDNSIDEVAHCIGKSFERARQIIKKSLPVKLGRIINQVNFEFNVFDELKQKLLGECICFTPNQLGDFHASSHYSVLPFKLFLDLLCKQGKNTGYSFISVDEPILYSCKTNHYHYQKYTQSRYSKNYWFISIEHAEKDFIKNVLSLIILKYTSENKEDKVLGWHEISTKLTENQRRIVSQILLDEFKIKTVERGIYLFRNTQIKLDELIYEAIEDIGRMCFLDEIVNKLQNNQIEYYRFLKGSQSLRTLITRRKDLFIYERRKGKSCYGLKIWEDNKGFKGGTIKDLVVEFLLAQSGPMHISSIAEFVQQFRSQTNAYSILQNLKLDKKNRFLFYKGGMIGLEKDGLEQIAASYEEITVETLIEDIFDY